MAPAIFLSKVFHAPGPASGEMNPAINAIEIIPQAANLTAAEVAKATIRIKAGQSEQEIKPMSLETSTRATLVTREKLAAVATVRQVDELSQENNSAA